MGEGDDGAAGGVEAGSEAITIKIVNQAREEMFFKVKKGTKLQKVLDAYSSRVGVSVNHMRFTFDGNKVAGDYTPKMLEMEENDQIDVTIEQVGGF